MSGDVFFTADTHWGHINILKYTNRPFRDVEEMDEALISNWNEKVSKGDRVYHVGDMFVYCDIDYASRIMDRLNGQIFLVQGNHDEIARKFSEKFGWIRDYYMCRVPDEDGFKGKQRIALFHYAMRTWQHKRKGVWHLYGHSHGKLPEIPSEYSCDIGVDCWDYAPVEYSELKAYFAGKMK